MLPKKYRVSSALKPLKPLKAPQAQESYLQSFQATQYTHDSLSVAIQQVVVLTKDIKKTWLSSQVEDIKDELGAIFKAYSKATKDKVDKVDKTELLELLAKAIIRIGLPAVPTLLESITAIPKLDLKVINLLDKLIFATQRASKPINSVNIDIKSSLPN